MMKMMSCMHQYTIFSLIHIYQNTQRANNASLRQYTSKCLIHVIDRSREACSHYNILCQINLVFYAHLIRPMSLHSIKGQITAHTSHVDI